MLLLLLLFEEENTWGHVGLVLSRSFYVNRTWTTIDRWSSSLCARYTLSHRPYKRTSPYDSSHKLRLKDSLAIIVAWVSVKNIFSGEIHRSIVRCKKEK